MLLVAPIQIWIARRSHFQWCFYYCAYHRNVRNLLTEIFLRGDIRISFRNNFLELCAVMTWWEAWVMCCTKLQITRYLYQLYQVRIQDFYKGQARYCRHSAMELRNGRKFERQNWDIFLFGKGVGFGSSSIRTLYPGVNQGAGFWGHSAAEPHK